MATIHSISRDDANTEIKRFLSVLAQLNDPGFSDKLPAEARDFFASRFVSFVFYKDQLDALYANVAANAYRVYFAQKSNNKPTIVIVPCNISTDETVVENRISAVYDPGNQYPIAQTTVYNSGNFDIGGE